MRAVFFEREARAIGVKFATEPVGSGVFCYSGMHVYANL